MSLLSDHEIIREVGAGEIGIEPFEPNHVNPASYDLTLAPEIAQAFTGTKALDVRRIEPGYTYRHTIDPEDGFVLRPGQFLLATSDEYVRIPRMLAARAEGKSSLGRIGLTIHVTAGYIDPGFEGQVTLEIVNHLPRPIILRAGMRIAQLAFFRMSHTPNNVYGVAGHYQGQRGPTESRFSMP